jgi:hypothetical protein
LGYEELLMSTAPLVNSIPIARFTISGTVKTPVAWSGLPSASLRSAFGKHLREAACITRAPQCTNCPVRAACAYSIVFEPPQPISTGRIGHAANNNTPPGYVIEAPSLTSNKQFIFTIVLIDKALTYLNLIESVVRKMLLNIGRSGSGCVEVSRFIELDRPSELSFNSTSQIALRFDSPLRLQKNGIPLRTAQALTASDVLMSAIRRVESIAQLRMGLETNELDFKQLASMAKDISIATEMRWTDDARYSARQGRSIPLGGLVGTVLLTGELEPFAPMLYAGHWLHIGKETSCGLGQYTITSFGYRQACQI